MTTDLLPSFKAVDTTTICLSKRYHSQYSVEYTVENLAWSADKIMVTCEEYLKDKIYKQLSSVSTLDQVGLLVLKLMLEFFVDVEDSALVLLVQSIQVLRMKDVPGENASTIVSYLKGAVLLLQNFTGLPTYLIGLLRDILVSTEN